MYIDRVVSHCVDQVIIIDNTYEPLIVAEIKQDKLVNYRTSEPSLSF